MREVDSKFRPNRREKAVLVGVINRFSPEEQVLEYLDELKLLVDTAGATTTEIFTQKLEKINPGTYIGKGKLEEIAAYVKMNDIDLVVFDDDLNPSQVRNIDKVVEAKVMDRSGIILHIFSDHARTAQAVAQVELAQLQWLLPRLTGLWTHLSKQKGGIGMKGAGEKEIETDRRNIRHKIDLLKKKLIKIDKQNATAKKQRDRMVRVSLVGYTNAGKSTIMNLISKANILAEDRLFATLDTTVRKVVYNHTPFLLSDTVGFIRKLPHNLVECFKSTLDEARESDILLNVVDVSNPSFMDHIEVVNKTLADIGASDKENIVVFNKIDRLKPEVLQGLKDSWIKEKNYPCVFISAAKKQNIAELREYLWKEVFVIYKTKFPNLNSLYFPMVDELDK